VGGYRRDVARAAGPHGAAGARRSRRVQRGERGAHQWPARSAMVIRGLADQRREAIKEQLAEAFAPCTVDGGYELPGVCLNAMAN
jgi:hypothetical protein